MKQATATIRLVFAFSAPAFTDGLGFSEEKKVVNEGMNLRTNNWVFNKLHSYGTCGAWKPFTLVRQKGIISRVDVPTLLNIVNPR